MPVERGRGRPGMARFSRSRSHRLAVAAIVAILLGARWQGWLGDSGDPSDARRSSAEHLVQRVVDGDTLLLANSQRVRLQGIDTPETVDENRPVEPWGPEAAAFTKEFVRQAGGRLRFERDGEEADRHGRLLRFAWHGDRLLNDELVRAGLARAKLGYDYGPAKKARLRQAQVEAQRAGRGVWSPPAR